MPEEWTVRTAALRGPFKSIQEAKTAVESYAVDNGFALVVKTSYHNIVVLACSQGGCKRSHNAGGWAPSEGLRVLRIEKVGCGYEVKIRAIPSQLVRWSVVVTQDSHTGHSQLSNNSIDLLLAARKHLCQQHDIDTAIEEGYTAGVDSGVLWTKLRATYPWLVLKDVENAIQKLKVNQLGGLTEMEALHAKLKKGVLSSSVRDANNRLVRLFFSPTSSRSLLSRNCSVLLMDCTYQTNKHKMLLLHIVGVMGTHETFTVM